MEADFIRVQFRMYHNKELPKLLGINKWSLNRILKKHRTILGPKMGYNWRFEQVRYMLNLFGIAYVIIHENDQEKNSVA